MPFRNQQENFSSLSVIDCIETDTRHSVLQQNPSASDGLKKCVLKSYGEEEFFPVKFVDEEIYAMVAEWIACDRATTEDLAYTFRLSEGTTSTAVKLGVEDPVRPMRKSAMASLDPVRRLTHLAPPQVFARSPRRNASRRAAANHINEAIESTCKCETA